MTEKHDEYGIAKIAETKPIDPPDLPYLPESPKRYHPPIGLIGCGGISGHHLNAYRTMGLRVAALCDIDRTKAEQRKQEFYPDADVYTDYRDLLARNDIEVVDIATHPEDRCEILHAAIDAGKHCLSQKPFVDDLAHGVALAAKAKEKNIKLAVNQNGRWAPHFSYMRQAVNRGLIGEVIAIHIEIDWDHSWIRGTKFEEMKHLILYDFAIHWFDIVCAFAGDMLWNRVYASIARSPVQQANPCMLAHAAADFEHAQATWSFCADTRFGPIDQTTVVGGAGVLRSVGADLTRQQVRLYTAEGYAVTNLKGTWFEEGFQGTMGELLCAIEEDREPVHNASDNLRGLALCFAAVESADTGLPVLYNDFCKAILDEG